MHHDTGNTILTHKIHQKKISKNMFYMEINIKSNVQFYATYTQGNRIFSAFDANADFRPHRNVDQPRSGRSRRRN